MIAVPFNSRAPLECCAFPGADRQIGVSTRGPFHHHGLGGTYVDVRRETVWINSATWGNCYPEAEAGTQVRQMTLETVAELDAVIAELAQHRTRLLASIGEPATADRLMRLAEERDGASS
jgi:hypothetical protein